jgi:hypothetical protein
MFPRMKFFAGAFHPAHFQMFPSASRNEWLDLLHAPVLVTTRVYFDPCMNVTTI